MVTVESEQAITDSVLKSLAGAENQRLKTVMSALVIALLAHGREELDRLSRRDGGLHVTFAFTRTAPPGSARRAGRITARLLAEAGWPSVDEPDVFVCGPTGFVESAANLLVDLGHDPQRIRTERFGSPGGRP